MCLAALLLDAGALIDAATADTGRTALHAAAVDGRATMVGLLLDRGASKVARDKAGKAAVDLFPGSSNTGATGLSAILTKLRVESGAPPDDANQRAEGEVDDDERGTQPHNRSELCAPLSPPDSGTSSPSFYRSSAGGSLAGSIFDGSSTPTSPRILSEGTLDNSNDNSSSICTDGQRQQRFAFPHYAGIGAGEMSPATFSSRGASQDFESPSSIDSCLDGSLFARGSAVESPRGPFYPSSSRLLKSALVKSASRGIFEQNDCVSEARQRDRSVQDDKQMNPMPLSHCLFHAAQVPNPLHFCFLPKFRVVGSP